jgi:pyruvate dehydrogenase E1 component alpha subunit/2-oxoisovalerate dehydrogenase E1 component alpha subunit
VVVVANNQYAYSTPNSRQFACADLVDRAIGYGIAGHKVDGTDLEACMRVVGGAISAAREGGGPQLIVADLLRLVGHGEHDDASYVDPELRKKPIGRDCLAAAAKVIVEKGWASAEDLAAWQDAVETEVDETTARVQREPEPDPADEDWSAISTTGLKDNFS